MAEEKSPIQLANEQLSIVDACNMLGMDIFDFSIASLKVYCPFGHLYHADEGRTKAMRIYPATNSAWCFACSQYFTPVKLIAMDRGITEPEAALVILESTNYVAPDYVSRWEALTRQSVTIDTDNLAEALRLYCGRISKSFEQLQFEDGPVSEKLGQCLALLSKVKTESDSKKWLSSTKEAMGLVLGESS